MDPLNIHHVIRHPLSRIETNNFQDKSGCSINGIRSFLFEQGIVRDLEDIESLNDEMIQDYRGYPIELEIYDSKNFHLSDEILRMKNVRFDFEDQSKPIHKLVSPEPHFIEEERDLIENHFKYLGSSYESDDVEDWKCFEMDYEGHLVSINSSNFQLSNESIEHLSNFPHLSSLQSYLYEENEEEIVKEENVTNFRLLSNLSSLSIGVECEYPELLQDLGLLSNLLILNMHNRYFSSNTLFFNPLTKSDIYDLHRFVCYPNKFFQFI